MTEYNLYFNTTNNTEITVDCPSCNVSTCHKVLNSVRAIDGSSGLEVDGTYEIIQCQGCKSISFRRCFSDKFDFTSLSNGTLEKVYTETLYPMRVRRLIAGYPLLPESVKHIYYETHASLSNNLKIITGIGIRALIESICKEKETNGNNLEEKIDDLINKGVLTKDGSRILHGLRILGNKAAHEVQPHEISTLNTAMDVIEHLLIGVYVLPKIANKILIK